MPGQASLNEMFRFLTIQEEGLGSYGTRKAVERAESLNPNTAFTLDVAVALPSFLPGPPLICFLPPLGALSGHFIEMGSSSSMRVLRLAPCAWHRVSSFAGVAAGVAPSSFSDRADCSAPALPACTPSSVCPLGRWRTCGYYK